MEAKKSMAIDFNVRKNYQFILFFSSMQQCKEREPICMLEYDMQIGLWLIFIKHYNHCAQHNLDVPFNNLNKTLDPTHIV